MRKIVSIEGMTSSYCENHVERALSRIDGVERVRVRDNEAIIESSKEISDSDIKYAVRGEGYKVTRIR